jgi:hypothetical protein
LLEIELTLGGTPTLAGVAGSTAGPGGGVFGVTGFDAADPGPLPTPFVALTVNVYAVPFVSPVTVVVVAGGEPVTVTGVCAAEPM